jgi:hypothetical protein
MSDFRRSSPGISAAYAGAILRQPKTLGIGECSSRTNEYG